MRQLAVLAYNNNLCIIMSEHAMKTFYKGKVWQ